MSIAFKVAGVLMHWYVYYAVEYWENLVLSFETLLEFQVFIPEGMCKKVKAYRASTSLVESVVYLLAFGNCQGREKQQEGGRGQQTWHVYVLNHLELRESPSNFNFVRKLVHRRVGNV